jgi:hypothetical protein
VPHRLPYPPFMAETKSWKEMTDWMADLLERRTGEGVDAWKERIQQRGFSDEQALRAWLEKQDVTGYAQSLLVMETFGYPEFLMASADELIDGQYSDRPHLRPVLDAILTRLPEVGESTIQARKGYVSLVTARRTFAVVQPTTRKRVDLGLRLEDEPEGRLIRAKGIGNGDMPLRVPLASPDDVDDEVIDWMKRAYQVNS